MKLPYICLLTVFATYIIGELECTAQLHFNKMSKTRASIFN